MATALITGGTSGIGAAFARQLAAAGTDLVLVARDKSRLASVSAALHAEFGIRVETMSADLAVAKDVALVAARIEDAGHAVDIVVNNAGFGVHTALTSPDTSHHEHAFEVMCRAILVLGGAAGRAMKGRGGRIITISSLQSYLATGSYAAIKAWVTTYSQSLAVELRGTGVTVTVVLPGWVRTEWHERAGVRRSSLPGFLWSDPDVVVKIALRDSARGKVISIPTVRYRVLGWFARHLPNRTIRWISAGISSNREAEPTERPAGSESPVVKADKA
jgi:short-subunit dehydrogenase